jgi:hypothetical protein
MNTPNYTYSLLVSSEFFLWNSATRSFSAEISDLHHRRIDPLSPLYTREGADKGFVMVSKKTGAKVGFRLVSIQRDPEGELLYWTFEAVESHTAGIQTIIYND